MCNSDNAFFDAILIFIGAIISGVVGWISSIALFKKQRRTDAIDKFKSSFLETYVMLNEYVPHEYLKSTPSGPVLCKGERISDILIKDKSKHRMAIILFSFHTSARNIEKIKQYYENYYNPLKIDDTTENIDKLSFGIYNMSDEDVEISNIKRKISGKNLALENLKKIIEAVD